MDHSALAGRLTCSVPEAAEALGIGRDAGYAAARRGEIPTLRVGRRVLVAVPRLLELLGADSKQGAEASSGLSSGETRETNTP